MVNVALRHIESELGSWTFAEWRPAAEHPLAWALECVWDFDGQTTHARERVFPDGIVELIVQLDDPYQDVHDSATVATPPTCVTGLQIGPMVIQAPPRPCRVLGVRLHPMGAWAVLDHPLCEVTGLTADLQALVGRRAVELANRCADAAHPVDRVLAAVDWIGERIETSLAAASLDPAVRYVSERIARSCGAARIEALRLEVDVDKRRLAAAFLEQIGLTPKRLARIHRFRNALAMLNRGPGSLVDVALQAGYYDQPHMNAEFRDLAGLTPRQFLDAIRYPLSVSLAES